MSPGGGVRLAVLHGGLEAHIAWSINKDLKGKDVLLTNSPFAMKNVALDHW